MTITRRQERRDTTTVISSSSDGILQGELLIAFDPTTGAPLGTAIGPMVPGSPDATTPANTLPIYPLFTPTLKAKLDGIENSADANPPVATDAEMVTLDVTSPRLITPAQILSAITANADSNVTTGNIPETDGKLLMLQSERDKLGTVQSYATDDQTGTEMVTLIDGVLGADNWRVNTGKVYTTPVNMTFVGPSITWTNKPTGATPVEFSGAPTRYRVDARVAVSIQLSASVNSPADGTHRLLLRYNITADSVGEGGTWVSISGADIPIATSGDKLSTVAAFPPAAQIENLWIQLAGDAATGTVQSPKFTQVIATMQVAVNTAATQDSTPRRRVLSVMPPSSTYTGAPVGTSEWRAGGGIGETTRWPVDFSRATQYQLKITSGASASGAIIGLDYSVDSGATWAALSGATIDAYSAATTDKDTDWLTPPSGVGACLVRMTCNNTTAAAISPVLRGVYMVLDETVATPFSVPAAAVFTTFAAFSHAANISWTIPTGTTEMLGQPTHIPVDLRKVTHICLMLATAVGAPAAGTTAQAEYSLDDTTWVAISGSAVAIDGTLGQKVGVWASVPAEARIPDLVWLRCTVAASSSATTSFRMTSVALRQEVTVVLSSGGSGDTSVGIISASTTGTITAPDYDVVLCYNTAAITVNLLPPPRMGQVFWCYGAAISFFGGTGQTIQGSGFTGGAGTSAVPTSYPFIRHPVTTTVWCSGRAS